MKNFKGRKFLTCVLVSLCTLNYSSISFAETQAGHANDITKNASSIDTGIGILHIIIKRF